MNDYHESPLSPELETLDQLQGGDLSLELVAKLFPSFDDFRRGVQGMLSSGDVVLTAQDGSEVPEVAMARAIPSANSF